MKKVISALRFLIITLLAGVLFNVVFGLPVVAGAAISGALSFVPMPGGVTAYSILFTAPGGIGTAFQANLIGLPQFLTWNDAGNPINFLRVETKEDGVLFDLNAAGLAAVNGFAVLGAQAANQITLRLANGILRNRNVTISGTTSAAGAINFFGASDAYGSYPFKFANAAILALNPTSFQNFTAIFTPTMATATDTATVVYASGHKQIWQIEDIAAVSAFYQEVPAIVINNMNAYIHSVEYVCAAATPAYVMSVGGLK